MKRLAILINLLLITLLSYSDTITFWHVYYNDSLIARFNAASKDPLLTLKASKVRKGDIISVRYVTCAVYYGSTDILYVVDEKNKKLVEASSKEANSKINIPAGEIFAREGRNDSKEWQFFLFKKKANKNNLPVMFLFSLSFTNDP